MSRDSSLFLSATTKPSQRPINASVWIALEGDPIEAIRALKQQDGVNLLTWGGGEMVRQLLAGGLVDELRFMIYPIVLGRGKHLFGSNARPSAFTLAQSTSTPGGVLLTRYVRSGEVRTGAFEVVE